MPVLVRVNALTWTTALAAALLLLTCGCGTTKESQATQQLLLSSAVDRSVSTIDFRPLTGQKVYLDTSYIRAVKGVDFVNADYVMSSLRQQIVAAGCLMQDASKDADIIIEARVGTLGSDDHRVTYGIPETNMFSSAASLLPNGPQVPQIPELSVARKDSREAAAKIAAFAYDRETRQAVWQSGISRSASTAQDTWVLGVGPFQSGSIRKETKLAGSNLVRFGHKEGGGSPPTGFERPPVDYTAETRFQGGWPILDGQASGGDMIVGPLDPVETDDETQIAAEPAAEGETRVAAEPEASGEGEDETVTR